MKKFNRISIGFVSLVLGLILPVAAFAATAPVLGTTSTFGIVSSTFTGNGASTNVTGDVCYTSGPGTFAPTISGGSLTVPCTNGGDQAIALNTLNTQSCTSVAGTTLNSIVIGGNPAGTFPPGCYAFSGAINITSGTTVTLDLTASGGDGGNVWVFKSAGALTTGASTVGFPSVALANGASATNVFWAPTATSLGANFAISATPTFIGTIIDPAGITLGHFANLLGRALDFQTTVIADTNIITVPTAPSTATLTLVKTITNNNGGARPLADFPLTATGTTTITGISGAGSITSATVTAGTYTLSETNHSDYTQGTWSCTNGITVNGSNQITLASSDTTTCTINNNDIAPTLHLLKIIVGGTAVVANFTLTANGAGANDISGTSPVNSGSGLLADTFALSETSFANYTSSAWGCVGGTQVGSNITIGINEEATCTITNTFTAPASGSAGLSNPVPPLIDVVKVPSPLALPSGPGSVTYTYTVRNIGTIPVNNITMVDDSCNPVVLVSGDINSDAKLDVNETWVYRCSTTLTKTHTNTVVATGWANGISAVDIASATVVVGVPIVPPLIHVTKVPNPLALLAGGGMVTYTNKVTNPGVVALSNVRLADDKCGPVNYISGDVNGNSKLDTTETWVYTCQVNLTQTTTNTIIATGDANGLIARDFAIATVVVSVPGLPKTGFPPQENNVFPVIVIISGIISFSIFLNTIRSKKNVQ